MNKNIKSFIKDIKKNPSNIEQRWEQEKREILSKVKLTTQKTYIANYRKAIKEYIPNNNKLLKIINAKGLTRSINTISNIKKASSDQILNILDLNRATVNQTKKLSRKEKIALFIKEIDNASTKKQWQAIWNKELDSLKHLSDQTIKLYVAIYYKPAIQKVYGINHPINKIIKLPESVYNQIKEQYIKKVSENNKHLIHIKHYDILIQKSEEAIKNNLCLDSTSIAIAIASLLLLTGRRPFEIACTGYFSSSDKGKNYIQFSGQAKTKQALQSKYNTSYDIPVLTNASLILKIIKLIRQSQIGKELLLLNNKEFNALQNSSGADYSLPINHFVQNLYSQFWNKKDNLTPKSLRPLYAEIAYKLYGKIHESKNAYFANILGHSENDLTTSLSYLKYTI